MIEKPCRCGAIKKNFFMDIGPFFVGDCCLEAGYDDLGNKVGGSEAPVKVEPLTVQEETVAATLEVKDEGEQPDPSELANTDKPQETTEEQPPEDQVKDSKTKPEKKKRGLLAGLLKKDDQQS